MGIFDETVGRPGRKREGGGMKPGCLWVAWVSESISCLALCHRRDVGGVKGRGEGRVRENRRSGVAVGRGGLELPGVGAAASVGGRVRARGHD